MSGASVRDQLGLGSTAATTGAASPSGEGVVSGGSAAPSEHPHHLLPIDSIIAQCEGVLTGLDAMKTQVQGLLIAAVDLRLRTMGGGKGADRVRLLMTQKAAGQDEGPTPTPTPVREDVPETEQGPNNHTSPSPGPDQPDGKDSSVTGPISVPNDCPHETIADVSTMGGGSRWYCFDCDTEIEV